MFLISDVSLINALKMEILRYAYFLLIYIRFHVVLLLLCFRQRDIIHPVEISSDFYLCPPLWTCLFHGVLSLPQKCFPDKFHGSDTASLQHASGSNLKLSF